MGNNYCNYCLNAAFCENACADYNDYLADMGELSLFRQTGLTPDEIAALRAENERLKNGHEWIKQALDCMNEPDKVYLFLNHALRGDRWRGPNAPAPPRSNFAAITESPERLAVWLESHGAKPQEFGLPCVCKTVPSRVHCWTDWLNRSVDEQKKE